jgi:hypothetical protein
MTVHGVVNEINQKLLRMASQICLRAHKYTALVLVCWDILGLGGCIMHEGLTQEFKSAYHPQTASNLCYFFESSYSDHKVWHLKSHKHSLANIWTLRLLIPARP